MIGSDSSIWIRRFKILGPMDLIEINKEDFLCPVCMSIFTLPVITSQGEVYCESCITEWYKNINNTKSPMGTVKTISWTRCPLFDKLHMINQIKTDLNLLKVCNDPLIDGKITSEDCEQILVMLDEENCARRQGDRSKIDIFKKIFSLTRLIKRIIDIVSASATNTSNYWTGVEGWTIMHYVCKFGSMELIEYCIKKSTINYMESADNATKITPMHLVLYEKNLQSSDQFKIVEMAIAQKVKLSICDEWQHTPIEMICSKSNNFNSEDQLKAVKLLVEHNYLIENQQIIYTCSLNNNYDSKDQYRAIEFLMNNGYDFNTSYKNVFPIQCVTGAANKLNSEDQMNIVKLFINSHVDLNVDDEKMQRPIHFLLSKCNHLCSGDQLKVLEMLITNSKIEWDVKNTSGITPIHCVFGKDNNLSSQDQLRAIELVVDHYHESDIEIDSKQINTIVTNSMNSEDKLKALEIIITKCKKNNDTRSSDKFTSIQYIVSKLGNFKSKDQLQAIKLLIDSDLVDFDAKVDSKEEKEGSLKLIHTICSCDNNFNSQDQFQAIKLVVQLGIDVNLSDPSSLYPIHYVCSKKNKLNSEDQFNAIKLMIEHKVNLEVVTKDNWKPIHFICSKQNKFDSKDQLNAIKLMIEQNVDFNVCDSESMYPIHYICSKENNLNSADQLTAIKLILGQKINFEVAMKNNWIPIHYICSNQNNLNSGNQLEAIKLLLEQKINFEVATNNNWKPIHFICSDRNNLESGDQLSAIKMLIESDLSIDLNSVCNNDYRAPITMVCSQTNQFRFNSKDQFEAVKMMILSQRVDMNATDSDLWGPIHYLCSNSNHLNSSDQVQLIKMLVSLSKDKSKVPPIDLDAMNTNKSRGIHFVTGNLTKLIPTDRLEIIQLFADAGVVLNTSNASGYTALNSIMKSDLPPDLKEKAIQIIKSHP